MTRCRILIIDQNGITKVKEQPHTSSMTLMLSTALNAFWSNNLVFMNSFLSDLFSMLSNTLKIPAV